MYAAGVSLSCYHSSGEPRPSRRSSGSSSPPLASAGLSSELVLQRADNEVHHRDVGFYAVELQLAVQLLRDACRQLDPYLSFACHLSSLPPALMDSATLEPSYRARVRSATPIRHGTCASR